MENLSIEKMNIEDINSISPILQSDFDEFWNSNILLNELNSTNSYYIVLKSNTEIIGFAGITCIIDTAELNNIVIKKSYRNNGYSKLLLEHLIKFCSNNNIKQLNLEVNETNTTAINLYKSFNFKQNGLRKGYYNGKDAILMSLSV